jgi:hypothetical protein
MVHNARDPVKVTVVLKAHTGVVVHALRVDPTATAVVVDTQHGPVLVAKGNGTAHCPNATRRARSRCSAEGERAIPAAREGVASAQAPETLLCWRPVGWSGARFIAVHLNVTVGAPSERGGPCLTSSATVVPIVAGMTGGVGCSAKAWVRAIAMAGSASVVG